MNELLSSQALFVFVCVVQVVWCQQGFWLKVIKVALLHLTINDRILCVLDFIMNLSDMLYGVRLRFVIETVIWEKPFCFFLGVVA